MVKVLSRFGYVSLLVLLSSVSVFARITSKTAVTIDLRAKVMYYFLEGENNSLLYSASKKDGVWGSGEEVKSFNDHLSAGEFRSPFVSADGSCLYFSAKLLGSSSFDLYVSCKNGEEWGAPEKLPMPISSNDNESNPSIAGNNIDLYFTRVSVNSETPECKTIYKATRLESGLWSKPEPVPVPVGTGCEDSPSISVDGNILYFASDRPSVKKKKKFNIYYSQHYGNNVWSIPLPIENRDKEYNEFFPAIDYSNAEMHVTRVMQESEAGDLYSFKLNGDKLSKKFLTIGGVIKEDSKNAKAKVFVKNAFDGSTVAFTESDEKTGEYFVVVPNEGNYTLEIRRNYCSPYYWPIINGEETQFIKKDVNLFRLVDVVFRIFDSEQMQPTDAIVKMNGGAVSQLKWGEYIARLPFNKNYDFTVTKTDYTTEVLKVSLSDEVPFQNLEYVVPMKPNMGLFEIKITDALLNKAMSANIEILDTKKMELVEITESKKGIYTTNIHKNRPYSLSVFAPGYMFFYTIWSSSADRVKQSINISLAPLKQGGRFPLQRLEFIANKETLTDDSEGDLICLVRLLNDNPELQCSIIIQVQDELDKKLVAKREEKIKQYFERHNILASRVSLVHEPKKGAKKLLTEVQFN